MLKLKVKGAKCIFTQVKGKVHSNLASRVNLFGLPLSTSAYGLKGISKPHTLGFLNTFVFGTKS